MDTGQAGVQGLLEFRPQHGYFKGNPSPGSHSRGRSLDREGSLGEGGTTRLEKEPNIGI